MALGLGVAVSTPVSAGPTSHTDCSQSANLGDRVCFDETDPVYGVPVIKIYSNGTTVYAGFPVVIGAGGCNPFTATAAQWQPSQNQQTAIPAYASRCPGSAVPQTMDGSLGCPSLVYHICIPSAANNDLLEWFVNSTTMEFVWVN